MRGKCERKDMKRGEDEEGRETIELQKSTENKKDPESEQYTLSTKHENPYSQMSAINMLHL